MAKTFEGLHGDLGAADDLGHVVVGGEGEAERERGLGDRLRQTQSDEDHQDGDECYVSDENTSSRPT